MITVCICTYNRAESLNRALQCVACQVGVNWSSVEVLVIDNGSMDLTANVVDAFSDVLPILSVMELKQGLSHARNRALVEAKGDWIVFTDDDVLVAQNWLSAYTTALSTYPQAGFAGGRVLPLWPGEAPAWHLGERLDLLDGVLVWYEISGPTRLFDRTDPLPFGASFALRRAVALDIGPFRPDLGVNGQQIGRGEETDFMLRLRAAGLEGIYVSDALSHHPVDPCRLSLVALYRYGFASGLAQRIMYDDVGCGSRSRAALFLLRGLLQLFRGRGDRFRQCVINAGLQQGLRGEP